MSNPCSQTQKTEVKWYFDGREDPWANDTLNKCVWNTYDDLLNEMIESAFSAQQPEAELDIYNVNFKDMVQYNVAHPEKRRRVCRSFDDPPKVLPEHSIIGDQISSKDNRGYSRFCEPLEPELKSKTFSGWNISQCPLADEWVKQNRHYKTKPDDTIAQIAAGIEEEGLRANPPLPKQAQFIANQLRKLKNKPLNEIMKYCVVLYARECFLYKLVNSILRAKDMSKVNTLGPYCCMLRNFLHEDNDTTYETVYRRAKLTPEEIQEYKNAEGNVRTWQSFTSTSRDRYIAQKFGSTLFIIEFKNDTALYYPGRDISGYSKYTNEAEVLLYPGVEFRIKSVKKTEEPGTEYIIKLSLN